jgi:hypothetical protein
MDLGALVQQEPDCGRLVAHRCCMESRALGPTQGVLVCGDTHTTPPTPHTHTHTTHNNTTTQHTHTTHTHAHTRTHVRTHTHVRCGVEVRTNVGPGPYQRLAVTGRPGPRRGRTRRQSAWPACPCSSPPRRAGPVPAPPLARPGVA